MHPIALSLLSQETHGISDSIIDSGVHKLKRKKLQVMHLDHPQNATLSCKEKKGLTATSSNVAAHPVPSTQHLLAKIRRILLPFRRPHLAVQPLP